VSALGDIVLLGSTLSLDAAAPGIIAVALAVSLVLALACRHSLRTSLAARIAFGFVLAGALTQVLAGELLLFLTGGAIVGYAMLALSLAGPRALTRFHALAAALLIVTGDLALLELVMILAKSSADLSYFGAGAVLGKALEGSLARFCLVLGFGSRLALVALCVPEGRSSAANIATLPGWVLLGACSTVGAIRLFCAGDFAASCAAPGVFVLWWVPVLALLAWQLPRAVPRWLRLLDAAGAATGRLRDTLYALPASGVRTAGRHLATSAMRSERRLTQWPVAMGLFLLLVIVCALLLLVGDSAFAVPPD